MEIVRTRYRSSSGSDSHRPGCFALKEIGLWWIHTIVILDFAAYLSYIYRLIFIACCYHSYGDKDFQCVDGDVKPRILARILAVFIVAHAQAVHLCCQPRRWNWAEHRALQSTVKRARAARHMRDEKLIV